MTHANFRPTPPTPPTSPRNLADSEKYMPEEKRRYLVETDKESYYNQWEWLEEFLDGEGAFYSGTEAATGGVL